MSDVIREFLTQPVGARKPASSPGVLSEMKAFDQVTYAKACSSAVLGGAADCSSLADVVDGWNWDFPETTQDAFHCVFGGSCYFTTDDPAHLRAHYETHLLWPASG